MSPSTKHSTKRNEVIDIDTSKLPSISQVVAFLVALSPFIGGAAGWFDNLVWQVQVAWVLVSGAAVCTWLWGRCRYLIQIKQNDLAALANTPKK